MLFVLTKDGVEIYRGELDPRIDATPTPAYDLPTLELGPDILPATVDGSFVQKDGSVWGFSPAVPPVPGYPPPAGSQPMGPVQQSVGYLSPIKMPTVWEWAQDNMPAKGPNTDGPGLPQSFEAWDAAWQANKYGVYKADPRVQIAAGTMNIVTFAQQTQPYDTHPQ